MPRLVIAFYYTLGPKQDQGGRIGFGLLFLPGVSKKEKKQLSKMENIVFSPLEKRKKVIYPFTGARTLRMKVLETTRKKYG